VLEIPFLNSHDGTSAYQLRIGIFRVVCTNGLIVSRSAFPRQCVRHRGNIVDEVVIGALQVTERFESLAAQIEHMEKQRLPKDDQMRFAERALELRCPQGIASGLEPAQLLRARRIEDVGDDLWRVTNRIQENLPRGGLMRRTASGRLWDCPLISEWHAVLAVKAVRAASRLRRALPPSLEVEALRKRPELARGAARASFHILRGRAE
jgi:hypothetical protein